VVAAVRAHADSFSPCRSAPANGGGGCDETAILSTIACLIERALRNGRLPGPLFAPLLSLATSWRCVLPPLVAIRAGSHGSFFAGPLDALALPSAASCAARRRWFPLWPALLPPPASLFKIFVPTRLQCYSFPCSTELLSAGGNHFPFRRSREQGRQPPSLELHSPKKQHAGMRRPLYHFTFSPILPLIRVF